MLYTVSTAEYRLWCSHLFSLKLVMRSQSVQRSVSLEAVLNNLEHFLCLENLPVLLHFLQKEEWNQDFGPVVSWDPANVIRNTNFNVIVLYLTLSAAR